MATGRQYTLSVKLRMDGQEQARGALNTLSTGLDNVRESAKGASEAVSASAKSASSASGAWRALGLVARGSLTGLGFAFRGVGLLVKTGMLLPLKAVSLAVSALKGALIGLAGVAVSTWLQIKAATAALRPAAEMEQYSIQLEVLTKSAAVASRRLAQLKEYARTTNFSPKEVIEASNLMQAFGLWTEKGMRRLRAAGDAANAFGKSITEVVTAMNYLGSGRSGEAFEALSRIGVTRQALMPFGLEFKKSGELITEPKKAVDIVFAYLERQFGGMTARQSRTWKGAIQQLGGEVYNSFSEGFQKALKPMTSFVTGKLIPAVNAIGRALKQIDWKRVLNGPLTMAGGLLGMLRMLGNPSSRSMGVDQLRGFLRDLGGVAKTALSSLGLIANGLLRDAAITFENFVTGGGVQALLKSLYAGMVSAFRFGSALVKTVLDNFSEKFKSDILSAIPGFGKAERERREDALIAAYAKLSPNAFKNLMTNAQMGMESRRLVDESGKFIPRSEYWEGGQFDALNEVLEGVKRAVSAMPEARRKAMDEEVARRMGWGGKGPDVNRFAGWDEPLKQASVDFKKHIGALRLDNTKAAIETAGKELAGSLGNVTGRLKTISVTDDIEAQRKAMWRQVNKELAKLARRGWDGKGNPIDTKRGLESRDRHASLLRAARLRDVELYSRTVYGKGIVPQQAVGASTANGNRRTAQGMAQPDGRSKLADELRLLRRRGWDAQGRVRKDDTPQMAEARVEYMRLSREGEKARREKAHGDKDKRPQAERKAERTEYRQDKPRRAAQYVPPQIADKVRQSGKDAAKEAKQEADNARRDAADKATVQSAVFLDEIRRTMARLATYLGQDFGTATAAPGATN